MEHMIYSGSKYGFYLEQFVVNEFLYNRTNQFVCR